MKELFAEFFALSRFKWMNLIRNKELIFLMENPFQEKEDMYIHNIIITQIPDSMNADLTFSLFWSEQPPSEIGNLMIRWDMHRDSFIFFVKEAELIHQEMTYDEIRFTYKGIIKLSETVKKPNENTIFEKLLGL